jgi:hypothetical protein
MRRAILLLAVGLVAGCSGPTPSPAPTSSPSSNSATITFPATDGVPLHGTLTGHGDTAVILSNMGDNDPGPWEQFAPLLVGHGYQVMTYSFRYPMDTNSFIPAYAQATVPDLLGAVAFARSRSAQRTVLIGASLGGITVGKVGAEAGAEAVVIISAEQDLSGYGLAVSAQDLAALTVPKLFIASEQDTNTPYALTKQFYDNAPEPKQFHGYAGGVHGVGLFASPNGDDLRGRLLDFLTAQAPA